MKKITLVAIVALASLQVVADEPLGPPFEIRECASNDYCFFSDPTLNKTTVYKVSGAFETTELYSLDGWFRNPHISGDGRYFVAGYGGLNLIPTDYSPDLVVVSIYEDGVLLREIKLKEIFHTLASLTKTSSHYHWGRIVHVGVEDIALETTEGEVYIVIATGKIYLP